MITLPHWPSPGGVEGLLEVGVPEPVGDHRGEVQAAFSSITDIEYQVSNISRP